MQRDRDLLSVTLLPNCLQQLTLSQEPRTPRWSHIQVVGPNFFSHHLLPHREHFPRTQTQDLWNGCGKPSDYRWPGTTAEEATAGRMDGALVNVLSLRSRDSPVKCFTWERSWHLIKAQEPKRRRKVEVRPINLEIGYKHGLNIHLTLAQSHTQYGHSLCTHLSTRVKNSYTMPIKPWGAIVARSRHQNVPGLSPYHEWASGSDELLFCCWQRFS